MTPQTPAQSQDFESKLETYHALIVLAVGLLIRVWLIHAYPLIFGGDSIMRLVNRDRILLSYQLPLLQAAIHYLGFISEDPLLVRYFMAVAGSLAGWGFYLMASALVGRTVGFSTALLFAAHPFLVAYSIVPYQEILMLAGILLAFYFFFAEDWLAASLALGLACLTRYEAWAAVPVFVFSFALRGPQRALRLATGMLLFGWAPLAWLLYHMGLAPGGTFVLDVHLPLARLYRYAYLAWISIKFTPLPVLLLALFGLWRFGAQSLWRSRRYLMLCAFLALFLVAIPFSAHGERDQPDRFVTAREAHILFCAVILLAGLGLSRLPRFRMPLVALCLVWNLFSAQRFVARETSEPRLQLSYELARYLDQHVKHGQRAIVLAKPVPAELLESFLDKAGSSGGAAGRSRALQNLRQLDVSPPDYQRTLVHSRLGKDQLQSVATLMLPPRDQATLHRENGARLHGTAELPTPDWIAVWNDFTPTNAAEAQLHERVVGQTPVQVIRQQKHLVRIYKE